MWLDDGELGGWMVVARGGGRWRLWPAEVAWPMAGRGELPRWWRGVMSVVEGVGRCGWCWRVVVAGGGGRWRREDASPLARRG